METKTRMTRFTLAIISVLIYPACGAEPGNEIGEGDAVTAKESAISGLLCPVIDPRLGVECPAGATSTTTNTTLKCQMNIQPAVDATCPGANYNPDPNGPNSVDTCTVPCIPLPFGHQQCFPAVNSVCPPGTSRQTSGHDRCLGPAVSTMVPPGAPGAPPCPSADGAQCPAGAGAWWANASLRCIVTTPGQTQAATCPPGFRPFSVNANGPDSCILPPRFGQFGVIAPPVCPIGFTVNTTGADSCTSPASNIYVPPITL